MIDRSEGDHQQKQQQRESLREVIQYCENNVDCRRQLVLQYFGERFDKSKCNRSCDNCERTAKVTVVDRTEYAIQALKLFQELDGKHTLNMLLDIFRGSAAKRSIQFQHCQFYGSGRDLAKTEAERVLQAMVNQQVFRNSCETNALGYVSSYLKTGAKVGDLLTGRLRISLSVCEEEREEEQTAGPRGVKRNGATVVQGRAKKAAVISDDEDYAMGYMDDYDYEDSFINDNDPGESLGERDVASKRVPRVPDSPETKPAVAKTRKNARGPAAKTVANEATATTATAMTGTAMTSADIATIAVATTAATTAASAPAGNCYEALIQWRDRVAMEKKFNAAFVVSNGVLGAIARSLPSSMAELKGVPGLSMDRTEKYGDAILNITSRYIL